MIRNAIILFCVIAAMFLFIYLLQDTQTRYYELSLKRGTGIRFLQLPDDSSIESIGDIPEEVQLLSFLHIGRSRALVLRLKDLRKDSKIEVVVKSEERKHGSIDEKVDRVYDYLILTDRSFSGDEVLRRFVAHKERMGLRVRIRIVEDILEGHKEDEYADAIREWLVEEWKRNRFVYLLLIGTPKPLDDVISLEDYGLPFPFYPNRKCRFYLGNYPKETPVVELNVTDTTYFLSREDLVADSDGETAFLYINGAESGQASLLIYRSDGEVLHRVKKFSPFHFSKGLNEVRLERFAVRRGDIAALYLETGALYAVPSEGTVSSHSVKGTPKTVRLTDTEPLRLLPLFQVECFRRPEARCGTIPMKILYPMGTYNAFGRAYFFDTHFHDCPSDYYYAALRSEWDRDRDGYAGEALDILAHFDERTGFLKVGSGDGPVPPLDVSVGRIPFDTKEETDKIRKVLERVMRYESEGGAREDVLVAVEALAPDTLLEKLPDVLSGFVPGNNLHTLFVEGCFDGKKAGYPGGYGNLVRTEDVEKNIFAAAEKLIHLWRRTEPLFALLISHGNCDRLGNILPLRRLDRKHSIEPPFLKYVDRLPSDASSVVLITGCNAAQPERNYLGFRRSSKGIRHNWEERVLVAEALLERSAFAVFAPTRSSWFVHNWKKLSDGGIVTLHLLILKELLKGAPLGIAHRNAIKEYIRLCGNRFTDATNTVGLALYGDPSFSPAGRRVAVVTAELKDGVVGEPFSCSLEGVGGTRPYKWSLKGGSLPDGLFISDDGKIKGVPKESGEFRISVSLTDADGRTTERSFRLKVFSPQPDVRVRKGLLFLEGVSADGLSVSAAKVEPLPSFALDTDGGAWRLKQFSLKDGMLVSDSGFSIRGYAEYSLPILILSKETTLVFDFEAEMERGNSYALCEVRGEDTDWKSLWFTTGDGRITPLGDGLHPSRRTVKIPLKEFAGRLLWIRFVYESNEDYSSRGPKRGVFFGNIRMEGLASPLRFSPVSVEDGKVDLPDGNHLVSISVADSRKAEYIFIVGE